MKQLVKDAGSVIDHLRLSAKGWQSWCIADAKDTLYQQGFAAGMRQILGNLKEKLDDLDAILHKSYEDAGRDLDAERKAGA